ncbi:hypothetical protein RFI_10334 [Reticulomyxa filosa]|uniref:Uncharacterized protein n=1 Tax=Reticulomyxa filosa TaxID=46433 RepID=X6NKF5_RETFI|nr:hypothetical protein RFI_10334 [Reticulomyxa filosa]|eukprot:ETO26800.1 hypothetical protein RFI_10334 [Reticulomyxa filosa]
MNSSTKQTDLVLWLLLTLKRSLLPFFFFDKKTLLAFVVLFEETKREKEDFQYDTSKTSGEHVAKIADVIAKHIKAKKKFFSLEYFPPKTDATSAQLEVTLCEMSSWGPQWMDITWGAGGTTSELTSAIAGYIQNECGTPCLMHLTCTNMEKHKIDDALSLARKINLRNILALRGDAPKGVSEWTAVDSGFTCALDLIKYIKQEYKDYFSIAISGYPEGHPNVRHKITDPKWNPKTNNPKYWAPRPIENGKAWEGVSMEDWQKELKYLKEKVDHGGQVIITQLFYDVDIFFEFVKQARAIGIRVPILPGIMPIRGYALFARMADFCKTVIPDKLAQALEPVKHSDAQVLVVGNIVFSIAIFYKYICMAWIKQMCRAIYDSELDIPGVHVYTMNTHETPALILDDLRLIESNHALKVREKEAGFKQMSTF